MCTLCIDFSNEDVVSSGVWTTLRELEDPQLRGHAELLATSALNSKQKHHKKVHTWEPSDVERHGLPATVWIF